MALPGRGDDVTKVQKRSVGDEARYIARWFAKKTVYCQWAQIAFFDSLRPLRESLRSLRLRILTQRTQRTFSSRVQYSALSRDKIGMYHLSDT